MDEGRETEWAREVWHAVVVSMDAGECLNEGTLQHCSLLYIPFPELPQRPPCLRWRHQLPMSRSSADLDNDQCLDTRCERNLVTSWEQPCRQPVHHRPPPPTATRPLPPLQM
jgi:hypothetical protein